MKLTIRVFAGLAELFGEPVIVLDAPGKSITVEELKQRLTEAYPSAASVIALSFIAKNRVYAQPAESVTEHDELALIPPVSGGDSAASRVPLEEHKERFWLSYDPLDVDAVTQLVNDPDHGATLVFVGTTRELTNGLRTTLLEYEAYEPMAVAMLKQIAQDIAVRWPGTRTAIAHRLGTVGIGEASVIIAVSTPHRLDCYEASRFAIERLKQIVPIWKKEIWEDGSEWKGHQLGPWNPLKPAGN